MTSWGLWTLMILLLKQLNSSIDKTTNTFANLVAYLKSSQIPRSNTLDVNFRFLDVKWISSIGYTSSHWINYFPPPNRHSLSSKIKTLRVIRKAPLLATSELGVVFALLACEFTPYIWEFKQKGTQSTPGCLIAQTITNTSPDSVITVIVIVLRP